MYISGTKSPTQLPPPPPETLGSVKNPHIKSAESVIKNLPTSEKPPANQKSLTSNSSNMMLRSGKVLSPSEGVTAVSKKRKTLSSLDEPSVKRQVLTSSNSKMLLRSGRFLSTPDDAMAASMDRPLASTSNATTDEPSTKERLIMEDQDWEQFEQKHRLERHLEMHGLRTVILYKNKQNGNQVIVKSHNKGDPDYEKEVAFYERIRSTCRNKAIKWPNYLPKYLGTLSSKDSNRIVLEYIPHPTDKWINKKRNENKIGAKLGLQAAQAMHELHNTFNVLIGGDLYLRNIIVNPIKEQFVFIDFGHSELLSPPPEEATPEEIEQMAQHYFFRENDIKIPSSPITAHDYEGLNFILRNLSYTYGPNILLTKILAEQEKKPKEHAIFKAITDGNLIKVKSIVSNGLTNTEYDHLKHTPSASAVFNGQTEIVTALISTEALNQKSGIYMATPLWLAAFHGRTEIADNLITSGADLNSCDEFGRNAIYVAYMKKHYDIATKLYLAGADTSLLFDDLKKLEAKNRDKSTSSCQPPYLPPSILNTLSSRQSGLE